MSKEKQIEEMAKVIDEFTDPLSARDIHKEVFSEQFANHLYNAGYRKQSEWISVEERLPEDSARVLVYGENGIVCATHFKGDWWLSNRYEGQITHWMPLPEAPKIKGGE